MKKTLSFLLALIMLVSCFGVPSVFAAEEDETYTEQEVYAAAEAMKYFKVTGLPEGGFAEDIDDLKKTELWNKINLLGMNLDFLYNSNETVVWSRLDVYKKDASGNLVLDELGAPIAMVDKGKIALNLSCINVYTKDLFYSLYGGLKLYTVDNAIAMANALGKTFYRDFESLSADNFRGLFGNETPSAKVFFEAVVTLSKLDVIVQENWCSRGRAFCEPVVNALGGEFVDMYSEHYNNGKLLAAKTLEAFFTKMNIYGPIQTIADAFRAIMASYDNFREPVLALFTHKMADIQGENTVEYYNSFSGLLEIIFCDCDPVAKKGCFSEDKSGASHFCPLDVPVKRLTSVADDDEFYMFMFYYLNLCGAHRNNSAYIKSLQGKIMSNPIIAAEDKEKVVSIFDGYFLNNMTSVSEKIVTPYLSTLFEPSSEGLFDRLRNSLQVFLKKIADYFDYLYKIFTGKLDYGQGNSPFM